MNLVQQNFISPTLNGLIGHWSNGVQAAKAHMTYATCAVDANSDNWSLDQFISSANNQFRFLNHIYTEYGILQRKRSLYSRGEESQLSIFYHDQLGRLWPFLRNNLEYCAKKSSYTSRFHQISRMVFRLELPLNEYIRSVILFVQARFPEKEIMTGIGISSMTVFKDFKTRQSAGVILENLIENAIKYNKTTGKLSAEKHDATIVIRDNGIGMAPEFVEKLGQGERIREGRADVEGTGTGWESIARHCKEMGWRWKIESEVGKGTTVKIHMNEGDFVEIDPTQPVEISRDFRPLPLSEILLGAETYMGLEPFAGYRLVVGANGMQIDVTESPIFKAVVHARKLMKHLGVTEYQAV